jgi:DNA (cytosine-5)-methyltransferase 1
MVYGSVCSGIEAATVAWEPLGWEPAWYAQFDPEHSYKNGPDFPSAVLAHRYPGTPNLGDMTKLYDNDTFKQRHIDLLVGGTPCQSFSLAGLRKGLDDPRGVLALEFLRLADIKKPRWIVWENVRGVLSHDNGRTLGSILGALAQLGYGFAYRVLDAQYFGVPQRRRRIFVVGYHGDWRRAAAVLFERESLGAGPEKAPESPRQAQRGTAAVGRSWWNGGQVSETLQKQGMKQSMPEKQHLQAVLDEDGGRPLLRWLTPVECERLQGFPDNYTQVPWKNKPAGDCPPNPRYRVIGDSMAIPVMRWIGERIAEVDAI